MRAGALDLVVSLLDTGSSHSDINILEIEHGVSNALHLLVGHHDALDVLVDEIVKAVDVLLDQTLDGQEGGHQLPFLLNVFKRLCHLAFLVKLVEIVSTVHLMVDSRADLLLNLLILFRCFLSILL